MGAIFGSFFVQGLTRRFNRISATTDLWSAGNFSSYLDDPAGDEIAQFTLRLDNMAKQLQSLLRRRQEMAVSEERNRLAGTCTTAPNSKRWQPLLSWAVQHHLV